MHTNSGFINAAPRTSRTDISFRFFLLSSLSKATVDHSSHLSNLRGGRDQVRAGIEDPKI